MGSIATITLYAESSDQAQHAFVAAFRRIGQLNQILSDYDPGSELSRACQDRRPVSPELWTVLTHAQRLASESGGAFDITVGPLTHLWRKARKTKKMPEAAEITEARGRSGHVHLSMENRAVRCSVAGMRLDAGGIAKGYAADEALAEIRKAGVTSALVAVSGDIAIGDAPPGKDGWRVKVLNKVRVLSHCAVSTSGDEFQFVEIDGVRYSHIIDPRTGMPLRDSRTVAVIAKTGIDADSLATAVSVAGSEIVDKLHKAYKAEIQLQ
jgi:FAD:protein FMN transferase